MRLFQQGKLQLNYTHKAKQEQKNNDRKGIKGWQSIGNMYKEKNKN